MSTSVAPQPTSAREEVARGVRRRMIQVGIVAALQGLVLFVAAGQLDWIAAWVYLLTYVGIVVFNALVLLPRRPDLIAERGQVKANTVGWDKWLAALVSFYLPLLMLLVAGLEVRFGGTGLVPLWVSFAGWCLVAGGYALFSWAMASNPYFSGVVRIQTERGHSVASAGPYRWVRHPGYVGMILFTLGTPALLGAPWAWLLAGVIVALIVVRTALEDRTLQADLPGYADYAQQTRYRLAPGIW